jgi:hypothetical protein
VVNAISGKVGKQAVSDSKKFKIGYVGDFSVRGLFR